MPIRFRCESCQQLSSISTRMAGQSVDCPTCAVKIIVPDEDGMALRAANDPDVEFAEAPPESESTKDDEDAEVTIGVSKKVTLIRPDESSEADQVSSTSDVEQVVRPPVWDDDEDEDEEFILRRADTDGDDLDMTPMIDVTFLLLIFFIFTASFSLHKTLQIPKPNLDDEGASQSTQTLEDFEENSVIVQIDERNAITIDYDPLADASALVDTLLDKKRSEQKNEIIIEAHDDSLHETVVRVIDAANEVGMERIRLASGG